MANQATIAAIERVAVIADQQFCSFQLHPGTNPYTFRLC
jgi:hypothetical protein